MTEPKDIYEIDIDDSDWFDQLEEGAELLPRRQLTEQEIDDLLVRLFPDDAEPKE